MSDEDELIALKAQRDMNRLTLMDRLAEARDLANPKVLAERARTDVQERARSAAAQALEIANDHRGVVVATASALLLWGMRNHVGKQVVEKFGPTALTVGKKVIEKAAPALLAPFTTPLIASLIGPVIARAFRSKTPDEPEKD